MPRYDFICKICGEHFEKSLHMNDDLVHVVCPNGHYQTRRIFSIPTVVYKGSGFYSTDHSKKVTNPEK